MTPPQKKQRGRTNSKDAPSQARTTPAKRAVKKELQPAQRKKAPHLKASLPGELYERSGQWWWRTRLPGEDKAKARVLRTAETGEAACDRNAAERIAVQMWEQAVRESQTRQITRECTEKVERLKAQFLDKVRQLTVIVESANARAQAEMQARVEVEAKLHAIVQTAGQKTTAASPPQTRDPMPQQTMPSESRPHAADPALCGAPSDDARRGIAQPKNAADSTPAAPDDCDSPPQTGICECCGVPEVPVADLETIDSGQLLCPDCLAALRADVSRIEAPDFSASRV